MAGNHCSTGLTKVDHTQAIGEDLGGDPYIEAVAADADTLTSETARNRPQPNPAATALAIAFGKDTRSYHGDVIITGGRDHRGHILGLREDPIEALTTALGTLSQK